MTEFRTCRVCKVALAPGARECPSCTGPDRPRGRVLDACLMLAGGSAFAVTLMACYGAPPHEYEPLQTPPPNPPPCQNDDPNYAQPPPGAQQNNPCGPTEPTPMATGNPNEPAPNQ